MRVLIASQPIAGHVLPLVPIVRALRARGHEIRWYTGRKYAAQALDSGAVWEPFVHARDYDDADFEATFPGRGRLKGLKQLLFDLQQVFVGQIEGQWWDLREIERRWAPDLVLADQTVAAALLREEAGGPPCALLGVLPLGIESVDTAPFGLGLPPGRHSITQMRDRVLRWLVPPVVFRAVNRQLAQLCQRLGLQPRNFTPPVAPTLMLQPTVAAFEYPRSDQPRQLHFIGPIIPAHTPRPAPHWWGDVVNARVPVILVTQGTLATDPRDLIGPALTALDGEKVLVIVAGLREEQWSSALPANARAAAFLPFADVLPYVSVYVSNGGYGGVQQALSHGVPCVVAGASEDKAEVAARVAYAGVGLNLRTQRPSALKLRRAVRRLLTDPAYRARAQQMGAALRAHDAVLEAVQHLEAAVVRSGRDL